MITSETKFVCIVNSCNCSLVMSDVDCLVYLEVSMWHIATLSSVPQQKNNFVGCRGELGNKASCSLGLVSVV